MSDDEQNTVGAPILVWFTYYLAGIGVLSISIVIGNSFDKYTLPVIVYLIIGFMLNRLILRQLTFHPLYDTISGVAGAKVKSLLFWPLSYLFLLIQITINKVI